MHELPDGWEMSNLGELADVAIGGTPSRDIARFWAAGTEDGFPWVSIADLRGRVISRTKEAITAAGVANSNVKLVRRGTVLMSFKLSLGRMAYADCDLFTNEAIAAFFVNEKICSDYLFYCLPDAVRLAATDVAIKGATLNKESLKKLRIPYPSHDIQKSIATILTSIDTAIEKTEALIAKYQRIKAGLMHDLFTRGVLPSGQLRPSREQAPELYQESAVGWIPRTWQPTKLREVLTRIDAGWSPDCEETSPSMGEWGVLKVSSVTRGKYDPIESKTLPPTMNPDSSIEVADGDVILTRANGVAELVGLTVQVRNTPPKLMLSDKLLRLVPIESSLAKDFLALLMQSNSIKTQVDGVMSGSSGQRNISQAHLKDFDCPLPPMEEQLQIARRMGCIEIVLEREEFGRRKLYRQKLGLMQDLLTGKVLVKVDAGAPELIDG